MIDSSGDRKTILVRERLRLLAWGYYIHGGFNAFMFSFFLIPFAIIIIAFASVPESQWSKPASNSSARAHASPSPTPPATTAQEPPPKFVFAIFAALFGTIVFGNLVVSGLTIYAGRCLQKRMRKTLVYVMAIANCIFIPYGTLLGVFTVMVLGSPEAQAEFSEISA